MKILILASGVFDKGGIARYVRYQILALRQSAVVSDVRVFSLRGQGVDDLEDPFEVTWAGPSRLDGPARALYVWEAFREARIFRPHVVVATHVNLGPLAAAVAKAVSARRTQNIYGREIWSNLSMSRQLACRTADAVVSDCLSSLERARDLHLLPSKTYVVHDCVDLGRFKPDSMVADSLAPYGLVTSSDRFRILLLGRLNADTRYKGTLRLLELLKGLPPRFEGVLAGGGDDLDYLRRRAGELGIQDRVLIPGSIHEKDLVSVYRSANAFFLVSNVGPAQGEGLPMTPIEAMACGVPAVVGTEDGSREILEAGGGIAVSPRDLGTARSYLLRLESDHYFARLEAKAARLRAEEEFGFEKFCARTQGAIVRGPGRRHPDHSSRQMRNVE